MRTRRRCRVRLKWTGRLPRPAEANLAFYSPFHGSDDFTACTAYTRFLLDIGHSQDLLALQVALAPCTLGYEAVAKMLFSHPDTKKGDEGNIYWAWIENYVADDYTEAVRLASGELA